MKRAMLVVAVAAATAAQAAEITLYKQPRFEGEALTVQGNVGNLSHHGFLDQASSLFVRSGRWQVCTQPDFAGDCSILDAGSSYATLDKSLNHRIESVRPIEQEARNDRFDRQDRFDRADRREGRFAWREDARDRPDDWRREADRDDWSYRDRTWRDRDAFRYDERDAPSRPWR